MKRIIFSIFLLIAFTGLFSQESTDSSFLTIDRIFNSREFMPGWFGSSEWFPDGQAYTALESSETVKYGMDIVKYEAKKDKRSILVQADKLIPKGSKTSLQIHDYTWSGDMQKLMIYTNSKRVWRENTRGDYWLLDLKTWKLKQLGGDVPESSMMFAKFSPDNTKVGFVSKHNIYVEDLETGKIIKLTKDGSERIINGTFDWVYEEEFSCQDGFRWSPDSKNIAYWRIDATSIRNFLMINNTDSIYSYTIPVQYPKVGEPPSECKVGVVSAAGGETKWMDVPGDAVQNYIPRMEWAEEPDEIIIQQINRKQNINNVFVCNINSGKATKVFTDKDEAWVDAVDDWEWINNGKEFTWISEKDGWRHVYRVAKDGSGEKLITKGNYDVVEVYETDAKNGYIYFSASPDNPTQRYLYRAKLDGSGEPELLSPGKQKGTHEYDIAPGAGFAIHDYSNINTPGITELISLPDHKVIKTLVDNEEFNKKIDKLAKTPVEFFKVTTADNVEMDGFMIKPPDFDPEKQYPVLFYVYGEPWGQTATDAWSYYYLWYLMLSQKGYLVMTMDNRGTPCPKGREWRKCVYRKIGVINSRDQAMATKKIMEWDFVDKDRIAVWGWSGGGSMTLNLMFRYPEIYKAGMAVAAVTNQFYYDNIYQERYMGLPSENEEDFIEGSPVTYAKNLEGDLLIVHGTGDDNVHYQNAEALVNELIKHNKQFQIMPYPNRSHGIYEGYNTTRHLFTLLTNYLLEHVEAGGK